MLMIIAHHYVVNSNLINIIGETSETTISMPLYTFGMWGKIGVNCFVLITGYFMCKSEISLLKFLKLFSVVVFYGIIVFLCFLLSGHQGFSVSWLCCSLMPIRGLVTNSVSCLLVFYLFIPFLNVLVRNMTRELHKMLIVLSVLFYSLMPSLTFTVVFNYVSWFIILYFIAAYIRIYDITSILSPNKKIVLLICSVGLSIGSLFILKYVGFDPYFFVVDANKILALAVSISLFILFVNLNIPNSKFINSTASTCFGVFLIHDNCDAMRRWLWTDLLHNEQYANGLDRLLRAIVVVLIVFFVCAAIEKFRQLFIEKPYILFLEKISNKWKRY